MSFQLGEEKKGYGVRLLPEEAEDVFAVATGPSEDDIAFSSFALLAGTDVKLVLEGERPLEEVLLPDPNDPHAFDLPAGNMLLLEKPDQAGHYNIFRGPVHVEECGRLALGA